MEKPQALTINLAKNRGETFLDRFISWALTAGRVIIILTEAIALGAFLYRFSLDRTLVDLHDHISQETAVVNLLKNNENQFRNLQNRLLLAKNVIGSSSQFVKTFTDILKIIPSDMQVTTFQMTSDTLRLEGTLQSITSLRTLVDTLKTYPAVTSVSLDKIQTNTSTASISVTLTIILKNASPILAPSGNSQDGTSQNSSTQDTTNTGL
jgi:Tfp pilus assembly protein PilN